VNCDWIKQWKREQGRLVKQRNWWYYILSVHWTSIQGDLGGSSILWEMRILVVGGKGSSYVHVTNSEWLLRQSCLNVIFIQELKSTLRVAVGFSSIYC